MGGIRSGGPDADAIVDADAEAARGVRLVVGVGEVAERVLVQQRRADVDVAERSGPGRLLDDGAARSLELDPEAPAGLCRSEGIREVVPYARESQVAEGVDVHDRGVELAVRRHGLRDLDRHHGGGIRRWTDLRELA